MMVPTWPRRSEVAGDLWTRRRHVQAATRATIWCAKSTKRGLSHPHGRWREPEGQKVAGSTTAHSPAAAGARAHEELGDGGMGRRAKTCGRCVRSTWI